MQNNVNWGGDGIELLYILAVGFYYNADGTKILNVTCLQVIY